MDWSKISGLIGAVTPTIATALGGPSPDALLYGPQPDMIYNPSVKTLPANMG